MQHFSDKSEKLKVEGESMKCIPSEATRLSEKFGLKHSASRVISIEKFIYCFGTRTNL